MNSAKIKQRLRPNAFLSLTSALLILPQTPHWPQSELIDPVSGVAAPRVGTIIFRLNNEVGLGSCFLNG